MLKQIYASRVENVNPFLIVYYSGDMDISPDSDIWMDTKRVDANVTVDTAMYDNTVAMLGIDEQTGFSEITGVHGKQTGHLKNRNTWDRTKLKN